MKPRIKGIEIYILVLLVAFEAIGALYGGINLMNDPSGESIKLPIGLLDGTIFPNFMIPGIVLFLLLGFFPLFMVYPLLFKPRWRLINRLNIYPSYHWAWTYTLYTAIMLMIWINLQVMMIGSGSLLQGSFGMLGIIILILTLLPSVKRQYRLPNHKKKPEFVKK
jgi:hypothetical protein